jgi:hypothetical protein
VSLPLWLNIKEMKQRVCWRIPQLTTDRQDINPADLIDGCCRTKIKKK